MSDEFQVTLTSDSSLDRYENNVLSEFTNYLSEPLNLRTSKGRWTVGVKSLYFPPVAAPNSSSSQANSTSGERESNIFVYLNIIEGQLVGSSSAKVILTLPPAYIRSYHQFETITFVPLCTQEIREISVSLRDKFSNRYPFEASHINTIIVLIFKYFPQ